MSEQVDPEDLHEVIRSYLDVCSKVVSRFGGHIAKYFGDGILVYFGYPSAQEDDAQRAVRTGLEVVGAVSYADSARPSTRTIHELPLQNTRLETPLQVRIGIHTGLVVIGGMRVENTPGSVAVVGETPTVAAGLLSVAEPNTVVISSVTYRLIEGLFEHLLSWSAHVKGIFNSVRRLSGAL
jgi:Adenylate cyclase, family 3 (some proteins contain HAMP domain)